MFHYQEQRDATNTIQTKAIQEIRGMWEEGGNMRELDRHSGSNEQSSDRASSSQDRSAHPARKRSLLFSCLRPDNWQHGQTSRGESSTSVEQRLGQQEMRELGRREQLGLHERLGKIQEFQTKYHGKLNDMIKKRNEMEEKLQKLEKNHNQQIYKNTKECCDQLHEQYRKSLEKERDIKNIEKRITWLEKVNIFDRQVRFQPLAQQRLKLLEEQQFLQKEPLKNMKNSLKEIENSLKKIKSEQPHQMEEPSLLGYEEHINDHIKQMIKYQQIHLEGISETLRVINGKLRILEKFKKNKIDDISIDINANNDAYHMEINKTEKTNLDQDNLGFHLAQKIHLLEERSYELNSLKIPKNDVLQHIINLEIEKHNEWTNKNLQMISNLDKISERIDKKLYDWECLNGFQHQEQLVVAARQSGIRLPRPDTDIWRSYVTDIYSDIPISISIGPGQEKKVELNGGQLLMLDDMIIEKGQSSRIDNQQRESDDYKKLAYLIVEGYKHFYDTYNKKGKEPQGQHLDQ